MKFLSRILHRLFPKKSPKSLIKYMLHPGYVISRYDGQKHYISYHRLIELYKLNPKECIDSSHRGMGIRRSVWHLHPEYNGDYSLPEDI
jgi:hypothetical protein